MFMYNPRLLEVIGACGVVTVLWAWPLPDSPAELQQAMRGAQAELYRQARMLNVVPLGPAAFRVALHAVFDTHAGPALVAEVRAAQLPEQPSGEGAIVPASCTAAMHDCGHRAARGEVA
ncbi:hypothetical protein GA0070610_1792 [Micromonospora echinofusca]|uniref:Uncharacterized protein n=1 Tax=Micromonospora echinofusca TaxID=47858 RepID=A0A1C5G788_MICEH|nr:hypothetical protein GA0070610_1792 [Micromonospora echinofusca]